MADAFFLRFVVVAVAALVAPVAPVAPEVAVLVVEGGFLFFSAPPEDEAVPSFASELQLDRRLALDSWLLTLESLS